MGRKSCCTGVLRSGDYTLGVGGRKREVSKGLSYAKDDSKDPGGLAVVKLKWFFPLAKH